jgi:glycerol-3-phosphate dehydrogenase
MKRDLHALADGRFDLVVAGGGVVGAAIARDAARRGLSVALIEARDFATGASEGMSHFVHGGIRYLTTGQIGQVRNSLRERATWIRAAPHQIVPQACITPMVGMKPYEAAGFRGIVALFNLLGGRNVLPPGERPPTRLSSTEAIRQEPAIDQPGLAGALVYHDCRVDEPERVVLGLLKDAALHGAVIANHVSCIGISHGRGRVSGVDAHDAIGGGVLHIHARAFINATGPWAAHLAGRLLHGQREAELTLSRGVHIVVEPIARSHSLNLVGRREHATVLP